MRPSNLPPGVTDRMIEEQAGGGDERPTYQVVAWHGEGRTAWYVVVGWGDETDWEVVGTFPRREEARNVCGLLNKVAAEEPGGKEEE